MAHSSYLRATRSETRELADREYRATFGQNDDWQMSNSTFLTAFIVIAAFVAAFALLYGLR